MQPRDTIAGRALTALPGCTVTGGGAQVALLRSPILRAGHRVKSVLNGVTTYYVGNHFEWNGSMNNGEFSISGDWFTTNAHSTVTKSYFFGSQRVAMRKDGVLTYLHADHLGSTSLTTNASGGEVARQLYYPYGEVRWSSGTLPTDYTFTGQRNESSFGLMDYNARYYDGGKKDAASSSAASSRRIRSCPSRGIRRASIAIATS